MVFIIFQKWEHHTIMLKSLSQTNYSNLAPCIQSTLGHVHKYETAFGCGVDILMAVKFLSIVIFQKYNQKMI